MSEKISLDSSVIHHRQETDRFGEGMDIRRMNCQVGI